MRLVLGLTAALAFTAIGAASTAALAQGTPAIQSGSNATDTKPTSGDKMSGGKMSGGKMSGGKMAPKKGKKRM